MVKNLGSTAIQKLEWKGDQVIKTMQRAELRAAAWVIAACVRHAKRNHPGWKNRSKRAQNSVKRQNLKRGKDVLQSEWGSKVWYVLFLELFHGSFLRNAADIYYPMLKVKTREYFEEMS